MKKDCQTTNLAPLRKVIHRVYFISSCNVCSPTSKADTTPTLKVAEFVNGAMTVTPLVEGIEDLQFDYGIDMDGNGAPDCYVSDPTTPPLAQITPTVCPQPATPYLWTTAATNWSNVMAVRAHVLARSTDTSSGWTDSRTYDMGLAEPAVTKNDHYKRHAYSAIVRLYNGSGQRETP
jgi:type IV pilus assembly protein PilW